MKPIVSEEYYKIAKMKSKAEGNRAVRKLVCVEGHESCRYMCEVVLSFGTDEEAEERRQLG